MLQVDALLRPVQARPAYFQVRTWPVPGPQLPQCGLRRATRRLWRPGAMHTSTQVPW